MYQYRQVLVRMRLGDSDRQIARAGLMGRPKAAWLRQLAQQHHWLEPAYPLPEDATLAQVLMPARGQEEAGSASLVEPYREQVIAWWEAGIQGTTIHQALVRRYGFQGSYSAVRRFLQGVKADLPPQATVILDYAPGEAAQVDFGQGPLIVDAYAGEERPSWVFVMTLCFAMVVVPPQVAIIGAGRIGAQVIAGPAGPVVQVCLPLSLTFDHRIVTGGEAGRFLKALIEDLERSD